MAKVATDIKPVISTVSGGQPHTEGEMDALLLGRTRVSSLANFAKINEIYYPQIRDAIKQIFTGTFT